MKELIKHNTVYKELLFDTTFMVDGDPPEKEIEVSEITTIAEMAEFLGLEETEPMIVLRDRIIASLQAGEIDTAAYVEYEDLAFEHIDGDRSSHEAQIALALMQAWMCFEGGDIQSAREMRGEVLHTVLNMARNTFRRGKTGRAYEWKDVQDKIEDLTESMMSSEA